MKQFFALSFIFFCGTVFGQSKISFPNDTIDLGTIEIQLDSAGRDVTTIPLNLTFVNAGNEPLILTGVNYTSTRQAEYPQVPVLPKQKAMLKLVFNRFKYVGYIKKGEELRPFLNTITIKGNFPEGVKEVYVKGFTKKK